MALVSPWIASVSPSFSLFCWPSGCTPSCPARATRLRPRPHRHRTLRKMAPPPNPRRSHFTGWPARISKHRHHRSAVPARPRQGRPELHLARFHQRPDQVRRRSRQVGAEHHPPREGDRLQGNGRVVEPGVPQVRCADHARPERGRVMDRFGNYPAGRKHRAKSHRSLPGKGEGIARGKSSGHIDSV